MPKPAIIAKLTCQDGKRADAIANFGPMFDNVRDNEPGTLVYALHEDVADPNVLWFYELYSDDAAVNSHGTSDTMKAVGRGLRDILNGRPEITRMTPVAAKGIEV